MRDVRVPLSTWVFVSASTVVVALALVTGITLNQQDRLRTLSASRLAAIGLTEDISGRLTRYFEQIEITSLSLAAIVSNNPDLTEAEFSQIARRLSDALPEVINVAAARNNIVQMVYPLEGNESVLGLDYRTNQNSMASIMRARQTRSPQLEGPITLVQGGQGFVVRAPVYYSDEDLNIERYWGVVAIAIDRDRMIEAIGLSDSAEDLSVSVSRVDADNQLGQLLYGTGAIFPDDAESLSVSELGTQWRISVIPVDGWPTGSPNAANTWLVLGGTSAFLIFVFHTFMKLFNERDIARRRLIQAIESLEDGFALFDKNDRLVLTNQRYRDIYELSADQIVTGARFEDIVRVGMERGQYPEAEGREEEWLAERLQAHAAANSILEQRLTNGRWLKIAERKTPDGSTVGFRVDITELKNSLEQAEAANRAKSEFLQVVSHELRTPLTAVIGFLSFLTRPELLPACQAFNAALTRDDADNQQLVTLNKKQLEAIAEFSRRAQTSSDHLLRLLEDVLDWSKLEQHVIVLRPQKLETTTIASELLPQFEQLARSRGLKFRSRISAAEFVADPDRLKQVLINLVGNAVKFTESGEVALLVESDADNIVFRVQDSGPGIPPEVQASIFDRFFQVDTSTTRTHGGVGLGLAISKHLAELHGGTISVYSELGSGSEFTVTIPRALQMPNAA